MIRESLPYDAVRNKIEDAGSVTILSHLNPDADTLGTALGLYALLSSDKRLKVEIVNASTELPLYLDFLPNFKKIKHHIDYADSVIISCDCGSVDRLGFDLEGRDIINIDHHQSNTRYGSINVVIAEYASASQVAFALFKALYPVKADASTCFYTALLSDTRFFTTSSVNEEVFTVAQELVQRGALPDEIARHFTQRRPLSSLRILQRALTSLSLYHDAEIAALMVTKEDIRASGATVPDMEGVVDYARSLATVEIAIFAMELEQGIRISLRSKKVDVSKVAMAFGGGGHKVAAGFILEDKVSQCGLQESIDTILEKIEELGILDEK
ncbi:bifunctional oligoribonuclease/PAP phosphatase NrnA [Sulfurovum sp. TSL1]|uniref:DHH family phosphoesterase n=1 Tax=Sulfurovum sp. TSL1 TaxID=2826994 RepID=UPI001CC40F68|nr:DHH family phosphoesterase [Sulfurovum sp. TSL1]GIT98542.1 phosphoesterase RecJ-like protein [Sulfurovum sp. TSL1]